MVVVVVVFVVVLVELLVVMAMNKKTITDKGEEKDFAAFCTLLWRDFEEGT